MATRADFYIMHTDNSLELLGCTSNEYYGDFETAKNEKQYRKGVSDLLAENGSIPGKWYWPWRNSKISDEVFIFKITPSLFNRSRGILMTKVHVKTDNDLENGMLAIVKYTARYKEPMYDDDGYYDPAFVEYIQLPFF